MPKFNEWLADFAKDKKEVDALDKASDYAVHSLRRFVCKDHVVWEIGFTYTERLVMRCGPLDADGVTIKWSGWSTLHEVELPRTTKSPFVKE